MYDRQAFKINGKFKFWGGLTVETLGGGPSLVDSLHKRASDLKIPIQFGTRMIDVNITSGKVCRIEVKRAHEIFQVRQ